MQDESGRMREIEQAEFDLETMPGKKSSKHGRVCRVGDVFKIRNCTFEITEISNDGISARGIKYSEYLDRKPRV